MRALARLVLLAAIVFGALGGVATAQAPVPWTDFKGRFLKPDGRIADNGNDGVSHSEGQGFAMLLAVIANDRPAFDLIWGWTRDHLRREQDALFAWRWVPGAGDPVPDRNDAADGDIFIAWALMRAGSRWEDPGLTEAGAEIRRAIREKLVIEHVGRHLLLPGVEGFRTEGEAGKPGDVIVNPSYLVFPAFLAFHAAAPEEGWDRVIADGFTLLLDARFGRYGLPPDWLVVTGDGRLAPAPGWPPRFGFDAFRVALYLAWGRAPAEQFGPLRGYFTGYAGRLPAWADLATGAIADYQGSRGMRAVAGLVLGVRDVAAEVTQPDDEYYAAVIALLTAAAWHDRAHP
ncbi:glycosyl hydrolase family 8 [Zavarzinia compransoris]|uniref:glycosyl hydrolase family 8 n=1 Tax=Zavarzinia marina TaxID=2911065 RepID=UPI001F41FC1B|nr:glycosyl hydrolase family 8 [Zavarzinia marina]MCF4166141.1 glycosyl hydrolase family 8 [Zavarzinia marina]